jgi:hypothetical protein
MTCAHEPSGGGLGGGPSHDGYMLRSRVHGFRETVKEIWSRLGGGEGLLRSAATSMRGLSESTLDLVLGFEPVSRS